MAGYINFTSDIDFESLVASSFSPKRLIFPNVICFVVTGPIGGVGYVLISN